MQKIMSEFFNDKSIYWMPDMEMNIAICETKRRFIMLALETRGYLTYDYVKEFFGTGQYSKEDLWYYVEWNKDFKYYPEQLIDFEIFKDHILIIFNCKRLGEAQ